MLSLTAALNVSAADKVNEEILAEPGQLPITSETFTCIRDMTKVRGFYVGNLKGDMESTLALANSETGGVYPPGSVVQLVPGEVMVKHEVGYSPATKGWEFFELFKLKLKVGVGSAIGTVKEMM